MVGEQPLHGRGVLEREGRVPADGALDLPRAVVVVLGVDLGQPALDGGGSDDVRVRHGLGALLEDDSVAPARRDLPASPGPVLRLGDLAGLEPPAHLLVVGLELRQIALEVGVGSLARLAVYSLHLALERPNLGV